VIGLDRLRALAARIATADHWDRLALRRIVDDLYAAQRMISAEVLSGGGSESATAVGIWRNRRRDDVERMLNFVAELERSGDPSISKLALANSQIQKLAAPAVTQMR
jgi:glutamate dehydrogenase